MTRNFEQKGAVLLWPVGGKVNLVERFVSRLFFFNLISIKIKGAYFCTVSSVWALIGIDSGEFALINQCLNHFIAEIGKSKPNQLLKPKPLSIQRHT